MSQHQLVHIRNKDVLSWHEDQHVFVYTPDNKCLAFCQIKDLDLYSNRYDARYNVLESDVYLEPVDQNKNLCQPKEKYFPFDCVGPRECTYPGVCYRFETEQQNHECYEPTEEEMALCNAYQKLLPPATLTKEEEFYAECNAEGLDFVDRVNGKPVWVYHYEIDRPDCNWRAPRAVEDEDIDWSNINLD